MTKLTEITKNIEKIAPLEKQEIWDNSGWQVRLQKNDIKKVMLCVSATNDIIKQAVKQKCDMIISHHPIFFGGYEKNYELSKELIKNHLPLYSIHTPFDKAKGGTTDSLINVLGFKIAEKINEYTKMAKCKVELKELVKQIKKNLKIKKLKISNYKEDKVVRKIAFCAGSGADFVEDVEKFGCDCFVTADIKYHTALDSDIVLIDVGHLESELPSLNIIKKLLDKNVECIFADEKSPIEIV